MPIKIQRLVEPPSQERQRSLYVSPQARWIASVPYDSARAWRQISPTLRRGTLSGGPSYSAWVDSHNPDQDRIVAPRPPMTTSILKQQEQATKRQLGALDWNAVEPLLTLDQIADQAGMAVGEANNPFAPLRNTQMFLASKDIEMFGNAPSRAADYALAGAAAIVDAYSRFGAMPTHLLEGLQGNGKPQDTEFKFQSDPNYGVAVSQATPQQLDQMARSLVGAYMDPDRNSYLVGKVRAQFDIDKNKILGLSSGDERIDYLAIRSLSLQKLAGQEAGWKPGTKATPAQLAKMQAITGDQTGSSFGLLLTSLPGFGTQIARELDPITPQEKAAWAALSPELRRGALSEMGFTAMGLDLVATLPVLAGFGAIVEVARAGQLGAAGIKAAQGYSWTLRIGGSVMTTGLAVATANWGLEAAWPEYAATTGRQIDLARPVSDSMLAGVANQIGYFASGTWGAYGLARIGKRVIGTGFGLAGAGADVAGIPHPSMGAIELGIEAEHGGAHMRGIFESAGFDRQGLELSQRTAEMSYTVHYARADDLALYGAFIDGARTGTSLDDLDLVGRIAYVNDAIRSSDAGSHAVAEELIRIENGARHNDPLIANDSARGDLRLLRDMARKIKDDKAKLFAGDYGPEWARRLMRGAAYSEANLQAAVQAVAERLPGTDFSKLRGIRGTDGWLQALRTAHGYEFHHKNGRLQDAIAAEPSEGIGGETMVRADHLFDDLVASATADLRSADETLARSAVERVIATREGEAWFTDVGGRGWKPKDHVRSIDNVDPGELANWVDSVQKVLLARRPHPRADAPGFDRPLNVFHRELVDEGVWELAYKPKDAEGNYISFVKTREGAMRTPFLDYPMTAVDNIELGNRGLVGRKWDALFKGFRTWRITEFQKASLYRNLTGKYIGITSSQIERFNIELQNLARKHGLQAQSVGTVRRTAGTSSLNDELMGIVERVFGKEPLRLIDGTEKKMTVKDWRTEISKAYRQSLRLNATAGIVSHMKRYSETVAWTSDVGYVALRFGLSPVFKAGEFVESGMYSGMRGINPLGDPATEALYHRLGTGDELGVFHEENSLDQMLAGISKYELGGHQAELTEGQRQGAKYVWMASHLNETFEAQLARQSLQERADEVAARIVGNLYGPPVGVAPERLPQVVFAERHNQLLWRLAEISDEAGNPLPEHVSEFNDLVGTLDGSLTDAEVRAANHVGTDLPSEDWSLDPAELGDIISLENVGLDVPNTTAEERGLWHATTNVDGVHESGLMSRVDLMAREWDEPGLVDAALSPRAKMFHYIDADGVKQRGFFSESFRQSGGVEDVKRSWPGGAYEANTEQTINAGRIVDVALGNGRRIWTRQGPVVEGAPVGAGSGRPDHMVSLTHDYTHVSTLSRRLNLQIRAAQGTVTGAEAVEHFSLAYDHVVGEDETIRLMEDAFAHTGVPFRSGEPAPHLRRADDQGNVTLALMAEWFDAMPPRWKLAAVQNLDRDLMKRAVDQRIASTEGLFHGFGEGEGVGLVGEFEDIVRMDASKVGVVQVGIRKGAYWHIGPDDFEVQMNRRDIWVMDQRMLDEAYSNDRAELLGQIRRTLRDDGSTIPGMTAYQDGAMAKLADMDYKALPLNPGKFSKPPVGSKWAGDLTVENVPVDTLAKYVSHDREVELAPTRPADHLDTMTEWMRGQKVEDIEPVIIEYDPQHGTASIADGNHRIAIAKRLGWDELQARVVVRQSDVPRERMNRHVDLPDETMLVRNRDGYITANAPPSSIFTRRGTVDATEDIFGSAERVTALAEQVLDATEPGWRAAVAAQGRKLATNLTNPVPYKSHQATLQEIRGLQETFPTILRMAGADDLIKVLRSMHVKEKDYAEFLFRDRELEIKWHESGNSPAAYKELLDHAGGAENQAALDAMYASEDWQVISSLWSINAKVQADAAFKTHFFNPYRSALERSLNHPLLPLFPISWALKAAQEWARFLYDNRMFGNGQLRLGMTPAVALHNLVQMQNEAMTDNDGIGKFMDRNGPFGSMFFIFNLMLPGDWSDIPFPATRTIRQVLRGQFTVQAFTEQVTSIGLIRDARLAAESADEVRQWIMPDEPDPTKSWRAGQYIGGLGQDNVSHWAGEPLR